VTEVRIEHRLAPAEVERRVAALAARQGVVHAPEPGGGRGTLAKDTPFGRVEARYRVEPGALICVVTTRPPFLPEEMVRRALLERLASELAER
jgi:hypothetical protein